MTNNIPTMKQSIDLLVQEIQDQDSPGLLRAALYQFVNAIIDETKNTLGLNIKWENKKGENNDK